MEEVPSDNMAQEGSSEKHLKVKQASQARGKQRALPGVDTASDWAQWQKRIQQELEQPGCWCDGRWRPNGRVAAMRLER